MKTILAFALEAFFLSLSVAGAAQTALSPSGTLTVFGDSTLHKWTTATKAFAMSYELAGGAPARLADAIKASKIKGFEVHIAVADLKSGESGLDKNLRVAIGAAKFPEVVYKLARYEFVKSTDAATLVAKTTGDLTIAGTTKSVQMDVEFALGGATVEAKGSYALKMSDYGIKPPTLMLGTIKVRDPVTIRFDVILKPEDASSRDGS